jgi:hypothetical protein
MDGYYKTDVISGMGHLRSNLVVPLVLHMIHCAMVVAPTLYYRSLRTVLTLLRMGNISSRPYCLTITITHNYKHIIYIYIYHVLDKLSSHNVACAL